jgi:hypothetical protein
MDQRYEFQENSHYGPVVLSSPGVTPLKLVFSDSKRSSDDLNVSAHGGSTVIPRYLSSVPIQFVEPYSQSDVRIANNLPSSSTAAFSDLHADRLGEWPEPTPSHLHSHKQNTAKDLNCQEISGGNKSSNSHGAELPKSHYGLQVDENLLSVDSETNRSREPTSSAAARTRSHLVSSTAPRSAGKEQERRASTVVLIALLVDLLFMIGAFNRR